MEHHKTLTNITEHGHSIYSGDIYKCHCVKCFERQNRLRCICRECMTLDLGRLIHKPLYKYNTYPQLPKRGVCKYFNYLNMFDNKIYGLL